MLLRLLLFAVALLSQTALVWGGVATVTGYTVSTPQYILGATPTQLAVTVQLQDGVDTAGDTVKIIFNKAFLEDAATPVVTVTGGTGSPVFASWATSAGGTIIKGTLSSGTITHESVLVTITNSFVAFPSTGEIYASVGAVSSNTVGDSMGAAFSMFNVIQTPTVTLTSADMYSGTIPSSLRIVVDAPFQVNTGEILQITATQPVLAASQTISAAAAEFNNYASDVSGTTVDADLAMGYVRGTTFDITLGSTLMKALPTNYGEVYISITLNSVPIATHVAGFGVILLAAMGSDPVARFGDRKQAFELPPHVLTPLVAAPELSILGSVFEGGGPWEQWFDRIVLTNPDQDRFLEIRMRNMMQGRNQSGLPRAALHTLDVRMGYGDASLPVATSRIKDLGGKVPRSFLGYDVAFHKMQRRDSMQFATIGRLPRECVHLAGPSLHFYVCSAPATEYFGHFAHLAVKYAHLDMVFLEVKDFMSLTGLLPELWGVQPMSESTRAVLLQDGMAEKNVSVSEVVKEGMPEKRMSASETVSPLGAVVAAGGLSVENTTTECKESMGISVLTV